MDDNDFIQWAHYTEDGKRVIAITLRNAIYVFDVGADEKTFRRQTYTPSQFDYSLLAGMPVDSFRMAMTLGVRLKEVHPDLLREAILEYGGIVTDPRSKTAVILVTKPDPTLFDVATQRLLGTMKDSGFSRGTAEFSPDGSLLATMGNGKLRVWDVGAGAFLWSAAAPEKSIQFSQDGLRLFLNQSDLSHSGFRVLDARSGRQIALLKGTSLIWSGPDLAITQDNNASLILHNMARGDDDVLELMSQGEKDRQALKARPSIDILLPIARRYRNACP